jgi:hypothetical protein
MWEDSKRPGMASKIEAVQKSHGLKDTMLQPFLDKMRKVHREQNLSEAQDLGREYEERYGNRMYNPFFRLDGKLQSISTYPLPLIAVAINIHCH